MKGVVLYSIRMEVRSIVKVKRTNAFAMAKLRKPAATTEGIRDQLWLCIGTVPQGTLSYPLGF